MRLGFFSFSLFFFLFLDGQFVLSLPDMVLCGTSSAGHVSYWAPLCLSVAFEVVALQTALGIGLGMDLNVLKEAAALERKETVTFCDDDEIQYPCFTHPQSPLSLLACELSALLCR